MGAHNLKHMEESDLLAFRDHFHVPIDDEQAKSMVFIKPDPESKEGKFLARRREIMGGPVPYRHKDGEKLTVPPTTKSFEDMYASTGERELSTTMHLSACLPSWLRTRTSGGRGLSPPLSLMKHVPLAWRASSDKLASMHRMVSCMNRLIRNHSCGIAKIKKRTDSRGGNL